MKTSRLILSSLLASSLAFGSLGHAQTTYVWVRPPEEGAGNWSDPDNWSQGSVPDSLDAVVMTGNWGAAQNDPFRTYILDQDAVVALFGVGWNDLTGNNGNSAKIVLEAGGGSHTLTIGSTTTTGTLFVGGNSSNGGWQTGRGGILTLKSGVTVNLLGASTYGSGGFYLGGAYDNPSNEANARGVVTVESGATLNLGSETDRVYWGMGILRATKTTSGNGTPQATGTFNGSGTLSAYISDLEVGKGLRETKLPTVITSPQGNFAIAIIDLSNFASALIDTDNLYLAVSEYNQGISGTVRLGASSHLIVGNTVQIGVTKSMISSTLDLREQATSSVVSGILTMVAGSRVEIGSTDNRSTVILGQNATNGVLTNGTVTTSGSIVATTGGTFSGYFSSLTLGKQTVVDATRNYQAIGVIDLRNATVTAFDVAGDVTIGYGGPTGGEGSVGALYLANTDAAVGGNLIVGDDKTGGGSQISSSGLLELTNTRMTVQGDVILNHTGSVVVVANGASAGLVLSESSQLSIATFGGYSITFETEGVYGFAWEGDWVNELNDLIDQGYITWQNNTSIDINVFYDNLTGMTYIASIPEAGLSVLWGAGLLSLYWGVPPESGPPFLTRKATLPNLPENLAADAARFFLTLRRGKTDPNCDKPAP